MSLLLRVTEQVLEAGIDEVGRGCLAGPVVAAAVILDENNPISGLNDSKKLTAKSRALLAEEIKEKALFYCIAEASAKEIDQINILQATYLAMHRAIEGLGKTPKHLAVDGNKFKPYKDIPFTCVVKGDGKIQNIAAASILAKCYRDELMYKLAQDFPEYDWDKNKGYPTEKHRKAIELYGKTPWHRESFKLKPVQLKLTID